MMTITGKLFKYQPENAPSSVFCSALPNLLNGSRDCCSRVELFIKLLPVVFMWSQNHFVPMEAAELSSGQIVFLWLEEMYFWLWLQWLFVLTSQHCGCVAHCMRLRSKFHGIIKHVCSDSYVPALSESRCDVFPHSIFLMFSDPQ